MATPAAQGFKAILILHAASCVFTDTGSSDRSATTMARKVAATLTHKEANVSGAVITNTLSGVVPSEAKRVSIPIHPRGLGTIVRSEADQVEGDRGGGEGVGAAGDVIYRKTASAGAGNGDVSIAIQSIEANDTRGGTALDERQVGIVSSSRAPSMWMILPEVIWFFIVNVIVVIIHRKNKAAGLYQGCGLKSFLCCFCCSGVLTICLPIDEFSPPPLGQPLQVVQHQQPKSESSTPAPQSGSWAAVPPAAIS